jgi:signal transduction histidine kinase
MGAGSLRRWLRTPVAGLRDVAAADVLFGVVVSLSGFMSAVGATGSNAHNPNAGLAAAVAVLLMTAPVAVARRWPVAVCVVLAFSAPLNWVAIGHLVRCGAGLVAVFYVAFMLGVRCRIKPMIAGLALLAVNILCQAFSDPQLGSGVIVYMVPVAVAFTAAGWLVASRNATVAQLRARTLQLRAQRDENARLAVAGEQARIAGDLDGFLAGQVDRISGSATAGRAVLESSPEQAREAFEAISRSGRAALTRMRDVVANLKDSGTHPAGVEPAPVLAQLDRLLAEASEGTARLRVIGDPRLLTPGLELSAYRIIERLLEATDPDVTNDDASAADARSPVEVLVAFGAHQLELTVSGPTARQADARVALAAASERAAVHGGHLRTSTTDRQRTTVVALPLVAGHV